MSDVASTATTSVKQPLLSNRAYDVAKFITQIVLPATGTLYFTLATLWGLPNADQVVGTIVAITAFMGILLGLSTKSYNNSDAKYDGVMAIQSQSDQSGQPRLFSLELNADPSTLENQKQVTFQVRSQ